MKGSAEFWEFYQNSTKIPFLHEHRAYDPIFEMYHLDF